MDTSKRLQSGQSAQVRVHPYGFRSLRGI